MSELTLVALRLGFVLALWIFVIIVVLVMRNDLFGTTVVTRSSRDPRREQRPARVRPAAPPTPIPGSSARIPRSRRRRWWSPRPAARHLPVPGLHPDSHRARPGVHPGAR